MITSEDFDFFLSNGYIDGLIPGSSMNILLTKFGNNNWYTKEIENSGLIYGIIKIGFIEFHVYNEKISGISYRPDIAFNKNDFKEKSMPWISKYKELAKVKSVLLNKNIDFNTIKVAGPLNVFKTAGATWVGLENEEHIFIDTVGGVTFAFETNNKTEQLEANQICKYYDSNLNTTTA